MTWVWRMQMQRTLTYSEVSLYGWPPAYFVYIQLLCLCCINSSFTCLVKSKPVKQEVSRTVVSKAAIREHSLSIVSVLCLQLLQTFAEIDFFLISPIEPFHCSLKDQTQLMWIIQRTSRWNEPLIPCRRFNLHQRENTEVVATMEIIVDVSPRETSLDYLR